MKNVKVLDCTLRDGGYINNWEFGEENIKNIISNLVSANVDIIECGFIRNVERNEDSSVYNSMSQLSDVINHKAPNTLYAVMIEYHNRVENLIPEVDGNGADIIRITFRRREWTEARIAVKQLIQKGYKVCVQPVGTVSYDNESLIQLIKDVNELQPYAFYLVDTLGVMYIQDVKRLFSLIDNNLSKDICIGFHSHNNLQMSFANAQEMVTLANERNIIVDTSCYGMGRGVGNLATELFTDYINNHIEQRYSLTPILNIVEKYLMPFFAKQKWGYDLPYFLSATVKCHPDYAAYLLRRETLDVDHIEKILSLIPLDDRSEYNAALIERLYLDFQNCEIDDTNAINELKYNIQGREVVIIGPGASITRCREKINTAIQGKYVISVNFICEYYKTDSMFISNEKRFSGIKDLLDSTYVLATSNLKGPFSLKFNYSSLLGEGNASDNAGAMLIRLLKKTGAKKIYIAGFDGFDINATVNYAMDSFQKSLDYDTAKFKNENISKQLKLALNGVNYELLTETKYEI